MKRGIARDPSRPPAAVRAALTTAEGLADLRIERVEEPTVFDFTRQAVADR